MKSITLAVLMSVSCLGWAGVSNVNKKGVALQGYDPVSYFDQQVEKKGPQKGDSKFQHKENDTTYYFASEQNRQEFIKNPKKYEPAYGGWCAYAVAVKKEKVDIDPKSFLVQDGRLLLFYKGIFGDTRDKWLHTKTKGSESYLTEADANWPETMNKEP